MNHIDTADFYRSGNGSVRANTLIREALSRTRTTWSSPPRSARSSAQAAPARAAPPICGPRWRPTSKAWAWTASTWSTCASARRAPRTTRPPHGESLAERFEVLAALREQGLIRHLGVSNVDAAHLAEARTIAPVAAVQNHFHIAQRDDTALLDACTRASIAFVPFYPLGGGRADIDDSGTATNADVPAELKDRRRS
ncbi:aldo/keto reductase [Nonomuraea insulae]|uniref:Aldo/keto reductase n=1 Tax=Nonomuraea insulae TaxID=1616787 RepID=A0ABW1DDK3_9ACTN